jgi:hypothetical protein
VADTLLESTAGVEIDARAMADLGAVDLALHSAGSVLADAAARIDADPKADLRRLAQQVRIGVEAAASEAVDRGREMGRRFDQHSKLLVDLTLHVRERHAEIELAELGALVRDDWDTGW